MEEIKKGEYVRTEIGTIGKVRSIAYAGSGTRFYGEELERNYYTIDYNEGNMYGRFDDDGIVNHSFNIIDLIEVGDIIKADIYGEEIIEEVLQTDNNELCIGLVEYQPSYINIKNIEIISIVTKEQFKNIEFKV